MGGYRRGRYQQPQVFLGCPLAASHQSPARHAGSAKEVYFPMEASARILETGMRREKEPARKAGLVHLVTSRELMPVEDGREFYRAVAPPPQDPDKQMKPTFGIAFGECEPLQGRSVFPTLHEFSGIVQGIFEAFRRAGLIR